MDKLPQSEIKYENRITKWFKNYWYYYKWKVIIAVFLIFVAVFCIAQACSNTDNDMIIMYAGSFASTSLEVPNIESALSAVLPEDYDGDGRKTVAMSMMTIYTEDQIKQLEANGFVVNRSNNQGELDKFQNLIVTGEYNVCLLEPWLYDMVQKEGGFAKLSEVLGYTPESAVDDYAIKLSDTDFGKYFAGVTNLPEDTYLCLRTPGALNSVLGISKSEKFEEAVAMVKAIVEFESPEAN